MTTKKHFVAVAKLLKTRISRLEAENKHHAVEQIGHVCFDLCDLFESENPKFDRKRFLVACGVLDKVN